ncbi:hypothetical protein HPB50_013339 [Hyalomma asiaticum]|uniref:Uncharacterized protein n=1 Tax=Hyalomma asiaticum TaxID=266040 RepID=A0ACB7RZX5_HYAAI|nr:hypothetical protein HPB50_013339 [Hyalomma asiaticum]
MSTYLNQTDPYPTAHTQRVPRKDHSHIMILTSLVSSATPVADLFRALKSSIDPVNKISGLIMHKTA